jgi:hypothetical protein
MERRLLYVSVLLTAAFVGVAAGAPAATADPNDDAHLAALHHGGLCCPEQMDLPISYSDPSSEISDGHWLANTMKESVTAQDAYPGFKTLANTILRTANNSTKFHPLTPLQSGELVLIATHYYGAPGVECALVGDMGGEAGYWYGRPGTIAPGCVRAS